MMIRFWLALLLLTVTTYTFAAGTIIATAIFAGTAFAGTVAVTALAMAINMVVAMVVSKAFANNPSFDETTSSQSPNPGNRQQVPPATDNKLPVVYGTAFVGGTITDLSISSNNQELYYVLSICEVTNTNPSQTADTISFGDIYFGGKKCLFENSVFTSKGTIVLTGASTFTYSGTGLGVGDVISFTNSVGYKMLINVTRVEEKSWYGGEGKVDGRNSYGTLGRISRYPDFKILRK
jgi:hypothetical protein